MSAAMSEGALLEWLRSRPETSGLLGDDAAIVDPSQPLCITVDSQIEGTHVPRGIDPGVFARRLLAVNLSDIAAMGARPTHAFLALAAPPDFPLQEFFRSFLLAAKAGQVTLAGGDLSRSERLSAALTLLGQRWPDGDWLRRDGAASGEAIWVGGNLGESALGCRLLEHGLSNGRPSLPSELPADLRDYALDCLQRHLEPQAQLDLGRWLASRATACTDVSDGLGSDLHHLCSESGIGAIVEEKRLPSPDRFNALARHLELDPLELKLGGGEDYVLLFTLPPGETPPGGCHQIGRTHEGPSVLRRATGDEQPLPDVGWDHLSSGQ